MTGPYWRLDDSADDRLGLWTLLRRTPHALRPLVAILRTSAPVASLVVLVGQLVAGGAAAFGLLATTGALEGLLAAGPTADRVTAAIPALALVVAAYAVRGALETGVALAEALVRPAVQRVAEQRLVEAGLAVDLTAFDDPTFYDQLHRARDQGLDHLDRATETLVGLLGALFTVVAAAVSLAVINPVLVPVLLVGVLPEAWAVLRSARVAYASDWRRIALFRRVAVITELATDRAPAAEVRAAQAQPFVAEEFRGLAGVRHRELVRVNLSQARTAAVGRALAGVGLAATFVVLGLLLQAGWVALAAAGTAVLAVRTAAAGLTRLVTSANQLFEHCLYVGDFQEFLDAAAARTTTGATGAVADPPLVIDVDDVDFAYPSGPTALHGITVRLRAGEVVALVGENGSGKTTLAKLLAGLYRPTGGTIRWDGIDLATLDPDAAARHVGMVLQEPVRWPHDARTNVRVGRHDRPDPGDVELADAALRARADEVITALPDGWSTVLSRYFRGGRELSGGQWQRLAVARGLFRDAPLLICDEPTAPLDARAEQEVFDSLRRLGTGRTVVLITHRLASVRDADRILVLQQGRLTEQGTHDELVAADGHYAALYRIQATAYA